MASAYNSPTLSGREIQITDCTLREGEQSLDVAISVADKVELARLLASAGVDRVQLANSESLDDLSRMVEASRPSATEVLVLGFTSDVRQKVDQAHLAGVDRVNFAFRSSGILLDILGWSHEEVISRSRDAIEYAVAKGMDVAYSPTDTTRADRQLLEQLYRAAGMAGASTVYVCDTIGIANPAGMKELVELAASASGLPVAVHCHNDFGLALANALAGCEAGASAIDTCINGVGERCGNPALDEAVVALELLYGATTNVALDQMVALSAAMVKMTGIALAPTKPIVGASAFAQKMDIHVEASLVDEATYVPFAPALVGGAIHYAVGKNSGPIAIARALTAAGATLPDAGAHMSAVVARVQGAAEETHRALTIEQLRQIVTETMNREAGQ